MSAAVAILAGGLGTRMGGDLPKQFLTLAGAPIVVHTLTVCRDSGLFDRTVLVIHPDWLDRLDRELAARGLRAGVDLVAGGATRQLSARAAVEHLAALSPPPEWVALHDAARCLVRRETLSACLTAARRHGAATTAVPAVDTVARATGGFLVETPPRHELVHLQTPQAFRLDLILTAHRAAAATGQVNASDDTQLVRALDHPVAVAEGDRTNLKISDPADLPLAAALMERRNAR